MEAKDAAPGTNQEELAMKILIDDEIRSLLPPHSEASYRDLREELRRDGCRDKWVVWFDGKNNIMCEGHTRMEICIAEKIKFPEIEVKHFKDRKEAMAWIVQNQLARRNLTEDQIRYYRGKDYLNERKPEGNPDAQLGKNYPVGPPAKRTSQVVAERHGVSEKTIRNDAKFAEEVDAMPPKEKARVLAGKTEKKPNKSASPPCFNLERASKLLKDFKHQIILFANDHICPCHHLEEMVENLRVAWEDWMAAHLPRIEGCERPGKCRKCGADIIWTKTKNDKFIPLDAAECMKVTKRSFAIKDGIATKAAGSPRYLPHLVTCPERKK